MFSPFSKDFGKPATGEIDVAAAVKRETANKKSDVEITQFIRTANADGHSIETKQYDYLDDLLKAISREEFGVKNPEIVLSAGGEYPYAQRELWTDACNFLTIKEGVIIGYDRNVRTAKEFKEKHNFKIIHSADLLKELESGKPLDEIVSGDTMILLPSSELSRARGGTHCMSMPLLRETVS